MLFGILQTVKAYEIALRTVVKKFKGRNPAQWSRASLEAIR